MWSYIYKKTVIDFSKFTIFLIAVIVTFSLYQARNFNLDASSDALLLEGDKDLKYLRQVNERYGAKEFLVLTYSPVTSFIEKETILNKAECHISLRKNFLLFSLLSKTP